MKDFWNPGRIGRFNFFAWAALTKFLVIIPLFILYWVLFDILVLDEESWIGHVLSWSAHIIYLILLTHLAAHRLNDMNINGAHAIWGLPILLFASDYVIWGVIVILALIPGTKGENQYGIYRLESKEGKQGRK